MAGRPPRRGPHIDADQPPSPRTPVVALERPLEGWCAVVLAAGRSTRMRSSVPKVLHPVAGRAMVLLALDALEAAGFLDVVVVTSGADNEVARAVDGRARVAVQDEPLGTGHAALAGRKAASSAARVLIVNADLPLLTPETLRGLAEAHEDTSATLTFLTAHLDDPSGYGRIARRDGAVVGIIEESETDATTRAEREVNAGLYAANARWLWSTLEGIVPGPRGERYLTDLVSCAIANGEPLAPVEARDPREVQQVNTRVELARAEAILRDRIRERHMLAGVTLVDPSTTYIDAEVEIAADTTILPGVHLLGRTRIAEGCRVGPGSVLRDMVIGARCEIGQSTLEGSTVGEDVSIGPYCHVRPGSTIDAGVHLGNLAEIKNSHIGARTQVGHFSYIGDADVGEDVNIGAGTITVNYDGVLKHRTRIGRGAFIGSDSMLIAPIEVGAEARTAAGSVVTRDVPPGTQVLGVPARVREQS